MGNPYFKFKQFTVFHDKCAMKVGSDGVLLGAWIDVTGAKKILDVGTGSGLIALMLAQRADSAQIKAIEIDENAVLQAQENICRSPWTNRVTVEHISLQNFADSSNDLYDLVISNPPFFDQSLQAPDASRTQARHTTSLPHRDLILCSKSVLRPQGRIAVILPVTEGEKFVEIAENEGLFCTRVVVVFPKPDASAKRLLLEFSLTKTKEPEQSELVIESGIRHVYSKEFALLVKEFYLNL